MTFQTERMILRKLAENDFPELYELDQDPEVRRYTGSPTMTDTFESYRKGRMSWIRPLASEGPDWGFGVARRPDESFLGWFYLMLNEHLYPGEMEIGFRLVRACWGQGLATEGARMMLDYAFSQLKRCGEVCAIPPKFYKSEDLIGTGGISIR